MRGLLPQGSSVVECPGWTTARACERFLQSSRRKTATEIDLLTRKKSRKKRFSCLYAAEIPLGRRSVRYVRACLQVRRA